MEWKIHDITQMPGFNDSVGGKHNGVSENKITIHKFSAGEYPGCNVHGALLKISTTEIWRCPACNEGCWSEEI